jgi:hypothetical protein
VPRGVKVARGQPGDSPPGIGLYADALAGLVPAEVLALHAIILSLTTKAADTETAILDKPGLLWSFFGLSVFSIMVYVVSRLATAKKWERLDYFRMMIPPFAFIAWTMLQPVSAFDGLELDLTSAQRILVAVFMAIVLGPVAAFRPCRSGSKQRP